jgi:hypothetical protein
MTIHLPTTSDHFHQSLYSRRSVIFFPAAIVHVLLSFTSLLYIDIAFAMRSHVPAAAASSSLQQDGSYNEGLLVLDPISSFHADIVENSWNAGADIAVQGQRLSSEPSTQSSESVFHEEEEEEEEEVEVSLIDYCEAAGCLVICLVSREISRLALSQSK